MWILFYDLMSVLIPLELILTSHINDRNISRINHIGLRQIGRVRPKAPSNAGIG